MMAWHEILVALALFGAFTGSALCQSGPAQFAANDAKLRKQYEGRVAQMFESIRKDAGLPRFARIRHRPDLEQLVCTAAATDTSPLRRNFPALLMYRTSEPGSATKELQDIARFKDILEDRASQWTRYAAAVWPAHDNQSKDPIWWVGIGIYESAMWEWIDNNLTDDRPYRNQWKDLVATPCRNVN